MTEEEGPDTRLKDAVTLKNAMQQLVASEGWKMLAVTMEEIRNLKGNEILNRPHQPEDDFEKGKVAGVYETLSMPGILLEQSKSVIEAFQTKEEEEVDAA